MRLTSHRVLPFLAVLLLTTQSHQAQSIQSARANDIGEKLLLERQALLSDLQTLESKAAKLDTPLARASAQAEIADAAWTLDVEWSKKLLRNAYKLTFPADDEQSKRDLQKAAPLTLPNSVQIAQGSIRSRILEIAKRDQAFADELVQSGTRILGKREEHYLYSGLAVQSLDAGDTEAASNYVLKAIDADPTLLNAGMIIFQMAAQDRKAADALIVQYIEKLRLTPVSQSDGSALRTYMFCRDLVTNNYTRYLALLGNPSAANLKVQPPGPIVMRAYVSYVIESLGGLEQREPGSAVRFRAFLLSTWTPLNQYAPELATPFLQLERLGRKSGEDVATTTVEEKKSGAGDSYEQRVKKALDSDQPDDLTINLAISKGDFDKARKMIDKLPDDSHKNQLTENVNTQEAIALAEKGEIGRAVVLAERLRRPTSVLQVYPVLLKNCMSAENKWRATPLVYQAIKQLKTADLAEQQPLPVVPASAKKFDPIPVGLSKLAKAVRELDEALALAVLDETVIAINKSSFDSSDGRIGFDVDVFKQLASKNEDRVRLAAAALTDHFRQIAALAAVSQWKASELEKKSKLNAARRKAG